MADDFPVYHRINAERLAVLAWSRAILLQLAHPLIGAAVADHSSFGGGGLSAFRRLGSTIRAMRNIAFGDAQARDAAIAGIRRIHDRVHGRLDLPVGPYSAGSEYSAHDPSLLLWVHVTLLESVVVLHDRVVERLDAAARDAYIATAAPIAVALGAAPQRVPNTWEGLLAIIQAERQAGRIKVGSVARRVAGRVLSPPSSWLAWPGPHINALLTAGLLPADIREAYGLPWSAGRARRFERTLSMIATTRGIMPRSVAWWPEARTLPPPPADDR